MSVNQSFNQSLYAPLTRLLLLCRPEIHFLRTVSMKRKLICKQILMSGMVLSAMTILLGVPSYAQQGSGMAPPGMGENEGPFSRTAGHGPQTFGGKSSTADKPAESSTPGEVRGVTRYANGLPMPEAGL
jgi:hypothetical protein